MHNLKINFDKIFNISKSVLNDFLVDDFNFQLYKKVPKMSDLQIVALSLTAESLSIDSENLLFSKLKTEYLQDFPNLIDRSNFNRRRKRMAYYISLVSERISNEIDHCQDSYIVDSLPIPICKNVRINRVKICKDDPEIKPERTFHACHKTYYYGFKLQLIISKSGIPFGIGLTAANCHDANFLKYLKDYQLSDCQIIADKGYISTGQQISLFEEAKIKVITPKRENMKKEFVKWKPTHRYQRKRIETLFSQMDDQMMIKRNYAKSFDGIFTRIITKISSVAVLQYINHLNKKSINNLKHALAA
jgi:hypothetical protein